MSKYRLRFSKTGRAVWISHLDLMHTLQRAFSRAGYRIKYSEGFNPHPVMSIALPLSVGVESQCEILDISAEEMPDVDKLNQALPEGIFFNSIYEPDRKAAEIKWLEIEGDFEGSSDELNAFFKRESLIIEKKTKRGISNLDIIPMIKDISFSDNKMHAVISAQNPTLNPQNIVDAVEQNCPQLIPSYVKFKRINLFDVDMNEFK